MEIRLLEDPAEKRAVTRLVLEDLPEWFGIPEAREAYIAESAACPFFCAFLDGTPAGFCYLQETGKDTAEVAAMGVRRAFHRQGIGRALLKRAKAAARAKGIRFCRSRRCRWGAMRRMTGRTGSIWRWVFGNSRCSRIYGISGIPARCM